MIILICIILMLIYELALTQNDKNELNYHLTLILNCNRYHFKTFRYFSEYTIEEIFNEGEDKTLISLNHFKISSNYFNSDVHFKKIKDRFIIKRDYHDKPMLIPKQYNYLLEYYFDEVKSEEINI